MKYTLIAVIATLLIFMIAVNKAAPLLNKENNATANINKPMSASKHINSIVLGAGCFWGAEKRYAAIPGVIDAVSGYADGVGVKPVYGEITQFRHKSNPNNHAEVVKVTYNQSVTNLEEILRQYFEGHDPTQINRQGNDIGTQYRSTILTNDPAQTVIAQSIRDQYQVLLSENGFGKIATQIKMLREFFPAEDYHQDYLVKNPNGYCPDHSTGVTFSGQKVKKSVDNTSLLKGKQIVVIESANFCPFCEKFKDDVVATYQKSTLISFRKADELDGLTIQIPTWATPTILFLEDGKEVFAHQGYMNAEQFYAVHKRLAFL